MKLSDIIENLILDMLDINDGTLSLQRNEFAGKVGCAPSQINYVIMSRFTPERGYIIESRRGGGGYIKIMKKALHKDEYLMHFFQAVGEDIGMTEAAAFINNLFENGMITEREKNIVSIAAAAVKTNGERADMIRQMILALIN